MGSQNEKTSKSSTYIIAGLVTAVIGAVVIISLVAIFIIRKRKVCFKPKHARFPFCSNHISSNSSPTHHPIYQTVSKEKTTLKSRNNCRGKDDQVVSPCTENTDWFTRSFPGTEEAKNTTLTRQFLTDGHERAVNFNYKITLYGYDSSHKESRTDNAEYGNVFMI